MSTTSHQFEEAFSSTNLDEIDEISAFSNYDQLGPWQIHGQFTYREDVGTYSASAIAGWSLEDPFFSRVCTRCSD
ncbi:hypothetical protein J32TS2_19580 [Shouchella clausii]|nr:hypothetical protein J32TS2_19580 [Shouchella clausii]